MACSGAMDLKRPGVYAEILAQHVNDPSPYSQSIDMVSAERHRDLQLCGLTDFSCVSLFKDVSRTLPNHQLFSAGGEGINKLRRVLTAYSWCGSKPFYRLY